MPDNGTQNKPNIIIFIMDATRAGHLSSYGYARETTPNVDRLAQRGVLYEQCISPAAWTLESMASMFTGLYPSQHGTSYRHQYLEPRFNTLAETLQGQGYQTALFATVEWISQLFGMDRGFETSTNYVQGVRSLRRFFKKTTKVEKVLRLGRWYLASGSRGKMTYEVDRDLRAWFRDERQSQKPFFIVAHLSDPHWPWFYHPKFTDLNGSSRQMFYAPDAHKYIAGKLPFSETDRKKMVNYYDGEIRFLDHYLGKMLGWLEGNGHLDNTLVMVTADHGEELAEHGFIGHGWSLYEWILHVPLVLYHPDYFSGGQRVSEPVQSVDFFPTILELLGLGKESVSNNLQGRSLRPEQLRSNPRPFTIAERLAPSLRRFERTMPDFDITPLNRQLRSLRLAGSSYKLIWGSDERNELYDLSRDPAELVDLSGSQPEMLQMLQSQLQNWLDGLDSAALEPLQMELDGALAERLQDLGYL